MRRHGRSAESKASAVEGEANEDLAFLDQAMSDKEKVGDLWRPSAPEKFLLLDVDPMWTPLVRSLLLTVESMMLLFSQRTWFLCATAYFFALSGAPRPGCGSQMHISMC